MSHPENIEFSENIEQFEKFSYGHPSPYPEVIHLNCNTLKLPYIFIPEINANFMIDTGSSRSFISPKKVNQYFNEYKYREVIYIH